MADDSEHAAPIGDLLAWAADAGDAAAANDRGPSSSRALATRSNAGGAKAATNVRVLAEDTYTRALE